MQVFREVELEGHIIDSGIMTKVFDRIMDKGGNFEIITFEVGKRKMDPATHTSRSMPTPSSSSRPSSPRSI